MKERLSSVEFAESKAVMSLYIETAKTFIGVSTGALALTMTFREKILGATAGAPVGRVMLTSWLLYLFAIGAGALYQYLAVKFLDCRSSVPGRPGMFEYLEENPGFVYGAMLISFFLASAFLVMAAASALP